MRRSPLPLQKRLLTSSLHRNVHAVPVALVVAPLPGVRAAGELEQGGRQGGSEGGRDSTSTTKCSIGLNTEYSFNTRKADRRERPSQLRRVR